MNTCLTSNNQNVIFDNDVVCGRGGAANNHKGNKLFRQLVNNHKASYLASGKVEKKLVAKFIIDTIRRRGGRFLKWIQPGHELVDIGDISAMEKACQALREGLKIRNDKKKISEENKSVSIAFIETPSRSPNAQTVLIEHTYPRISYPMTANQLNYNPYLRDYNTANHSQPHHVHGQQGYIHPDVQNIQYNQNFNYNSKQYVGRCTCKKSSCLKLYCQCFANSLYCSPNDCRCKNCYNSSYYYDMVHKAKSTIAVKNFTKQQHNNKEATNHLARCG